MKDWDEMQAHTYRCWRLISPWKSLSGSESIWFPNNDLQFNWNDSGVTSNRNAVTISNEKFVRTWLALPRGYRQRSCTGTNPNFAESYIISKFESERWRLHESMLNTTWRLHRQSNLCCYLQQFAVKCQDTSHKLTSMLNPGFTFKSEFQWFGIDI